MFSQANPIKVLIVVEYDLFRNGLINLVNGQSDFIVVGAASSGMEAVQFARRQQIEVALIDTIIPSETIRTLKDGSEVKVLVLEVDSKPSEISSVLMMGADGFLLKTATPEHLYQSTRQVVKQGSLTHKLIPIKKPIATTSDWVALSR